MLELKLISAVSRGAKLAWDHLFRCVMPKPTAHQTPPKPQFDPPVRLQLIEDRARLACIFKIAIDKNQIPDEVKAFINSCIPQYLMTDEGTSIFYAVFRNVQKRNPALDQCMKKYCQIVHHDTNKIADLINELILIGRLHKSITKRKHREIMGAILDLNLSMAQYEQEIVILLKSILGSKYYENFGSGFVIEESGYIITANHVINAAKGIKIIVDKFNYNARVIINDPDIDLAVLKIDTSLPAIGFHHLSVRLSQPVIALGFPNPLEYGSSISVAEGAINSLTGYQDDSRHYQISSLVDRGFSGGPLIDERSGGVVGVIAQQHKRHVKCSYAIKADALIKFLAKYPTLLHSIKYIRFEGFHREAIVERVCNSVVQVLAYY